MRVHDMTPTQQLAGYYVNAPDVSQTPYVRGMARELQQHVAREFDALPFRVQFTTDQDPYGFTGLAPEIGRVVAAIKAGRLLVYSGGTGSPLWDDRFNLKLRAVHDWHHVQCGGGFDLPGEQAAYRFAANKYPGLAPLLFSEIVLQAATALHFGVFPQQKVVL